MYSRHCQVDHSRPVKVKSGRCPGNCCCKVLQGRREFFGVHKYQLLLSSAPTPLLLDPGYRSFRRESVSFVLLRSALHRTMPPHLLGVFHHSSSHAQMCWICTPSPHALSRYDYRPCVKFLRCLATAGQMKHEQRRACTPSTAHTRACQ